jgi:uncharacterized protein YpuA (DUF1002 family)
MNVQYQQRSIEITKHLLAGDLTGALTKDQMRNILRDLEYDKLGINIDTLTEDQMRNILRAATELERAKMDLQKLKSGIR